MARPRAGEWLEHEVTHWKASGIEIVLSLLEPDEISDLGLEAEAALCGDNNIKYLSYPIPDRGVPNRDEAMRFAARVSNMQKPTAVHCRAGIGRSSIMAAAILVCRGFEPAVALSAIQQARKIRIPDTKIQREWVMRLK